jgi:hypothetical protein
MYLNDSRKKATCIHLPEWLKYIFLGEGRTLYVLKVILENIIRDAVTSTEHAKEKIVTAIDVFYALKKQGRTLYGFEGQNN